MLSIRKSLQIQQYRWDESKWMEKGISKQIRNIYVISDKIDFTANEITRDRGIGEFYIAADQYFKILRVIKNKDYLSK